MEINNPRILVISSVSPSIGPAIIGEQIYEALKQKGLEVDFMTKYPEPDHPEYLSVMKRENKIQRQICRIKNKIRWLIVGGEQKESGHFFFYTYEKWPPVSTNKVLKAIKKHYDLVYIVFWQELLSFETVEKIYDKLHCQIHFSAVDYSQMSGGCHFTGNCQRYKIGCGKCPAFHSMNEKDFTAWNIKFRKRVYDKVRPIVGGNMYMYQFYKDSFLLKDARIEMGSGSPIINTNTFHPIEKDSLYKKYVIPDNKKFIIMFGCQALDDERKGISYLLDAFTQLYHLIEHQSHDVLIIAVGKNFDKIKDQIPFESRSFGYVPLNNLPELYSLATMFVCPSVNDAGPMMVNQSLCCGTPVVGFDMGAVKQVVKDKGTGICVPLRDSKALAEGMQRILQMSSEEYHKMSSKAREVALQTSSYEAHANYILSTYQKYINN